MPFPLLGRRRGGASALLLLVLALAAGVVDFAAAYPKKLVDDKRCAVPLQEGQKIMGYPVVQSKDAVVVVKRGDVELASGDAYVPGEVLKISLPATVKASPVFEAMGGGFQAGKCGDRRMLPNDDGFAEFVAPTDGFDVLIWAGYATKKEPVTVTQAFLLKGTMGARSLAPGVTPPPAAKPAAAAKAQDAAAAGDSSNNNNNRNLRTEA